MDPPALDPESLRQALARRRGERGVPVLRQVLDRATFVLTDSELEGVDFLWPELGLVVETDGLRYHRTPAQRARDTVRDNAHRAAGLTPVRFTHGQVRFEPGYVERTLSRIAELCRSGEASPAPTPHS